MKVMLALTVLSLFVSSNFGDSLQANALRDDPPKRTVIIDASKDGGVWWSPQGAGGFDPKELHQGEKLANYLKSKGWEVIEIPTGENISTRLKDGAIVIRMTFFSRYDKSEAIAYRDFVKRGGKVLLVQGYVRVGDGGKDLVALEFGIRFKGMVRDSSVKQWGDHPITQGINRLSFHVGSIISKSPDNTIPLAYLDDSQLVMGMASYGEGSIIFLSSPFPLLGVDQPLIDRLIKELARAN